MSRSENPYDPPPKPTEPPIQAGGPVEAASALDAIIPTNPLAAISCYTGIISMICCIGGVLLGPLAIATGIMGLRSWKAHETAYGKTTSTIRAWIGIVTGVIGLIVGIIALVFMALGSFG